MAACSKLSTKRNGGAGVRRVAELRSWRRKVCSRETCQQGPEDKGLIWASHVVTLEALWVRMVVRKVRGRGKEKGKKRKGDGRSFQPGSSAFLGLKANVESAGSMPVLPPRPSQWFPLERRRDMARGAERGRALSRWHSPSSADVKGGTSPSRDAERFLWAA